MEKCYESMRHDDALIDQAVVKDLVSSPKKYRSGVRLATSDDDAQQRYKKSWILSGSKRKKTSRHVCV